MTRPKLHIVSEDEPSAEDLLRQHFATRREVHNQLKDIDGAITALGRIVAKERGVAFIRFEHLQREFGPPRKPA